MQKTIKFSFYLLFLLSSCNFYDELFKEKEKIDKADSSDFYKVSFNIDEIFSKKSIVAYDLIITKQNEERESSPAPQELYWEQIERGYHLHIARNLTQSYQGYFKIVTDSQRKKSLPFQLQLNKAGELIFIGKGNPNRYTEQKWSKSRQELEFRWIEKPLFENRLSSVIDLSNNGSHLFWINNFGEFALAKINDRNLKWVSLPGERAREPAQQSCLTADALLLASQYRGLLIALLSDHSLKRRQLLPLKDITHLSCYENTIALNSRSKGVLMLQLDKDKLLSQNNYTTYFANLSQISDLQLTKHHLLVAFRNGSIQIGERNNNDINLFTHKSFSTQNNYVQKFYTGENRLAWLDNKASFFIAEFAENELIWQEQELPFSGQPFAAFFIDGKLFFSQNNPFEIYLETPFDSSWQRLTQVDFPLEIKSLSVHSKWLFVATKDALYHAKKSDKNYWKLQ